MPRRAGKSVSVTVDIEPGPTSPGQKQAWARFWRRVITEVVKASGQ